MIRSARRTAFAVAAVLAAAAVTTEAKGGKPAPPPPPPPPANPAITYIDSHKSQGRTYADLMVMNADGSNKRLILTVGSASIHRPDWSPDGQQLVFWNGALASLCTIRLDGTGLMPIVATADTYGGLAQPSWSPGPVPGALGESAVRIAYADDVPPLNGQSVTELFVVDPDGSHPIRITNTPDVGEESPTWSPSATRLAFAMYTNDSATSHRTVGIHDFTTDTTTIVTPGGALAGGTIWDPDWSKTSEDRIAVRGTTAAGISGIWIIDLANPNSPVLVAGEPAIQPSWSPDDAKIVFQGIVQGNGIEVVNVNGSGRATLSSTGRYPAWRRNP
jgi:Tol biopolymer transport system component